MQTECKSRSLETKAVALGVSETEAISGKLERL